MTEGVQRWWTVEEANGELARIQAVLDDARRAVAAAAGAAAALQQAARSNGHGRLPAGLRGALVGIDELQREGVVVRDLDRGLVDFAARSASGRRYWLCWVVGEAAVEWWHWPEDGFAGRRPLSEPPD